MAAMAAVGPPPPAAGTDRNRVAAWLVAFLSLLLAAAVAPENSKAAGERGTFLHVSDIHFDPFATPGIVPRLLPLNVDQWRDRFSREPDQVMAGFGRDTNFPLLDSALGALRAAAPEADFTIFTGDLLAHEFEAKAAQAFGVDERSTLVQAFAVATTNFVARTLGRAIPGRPVIIALGNNDAACGDYRIDPGGPYLAATRGTVRELLGNLEVDADFDRTYLAGGYYAVRHPARPDITILVLNDVLWSNEYRDACGADGLAAGKAMLEWLRMRLEHHQKAGGRVWLVHHIPIGYDAYATSQVTGERCPARPVPFLRQPFARDFIELIRDHSAVIDAGFAGHIHYDDFRLLMSRRGQAVAAEKIAPGISPIFGQNPGFHVFTYDRLGGRPTDYSTHYLTNLAAGSSARDGRWEREYSFTRRYGQRRYAAAAVANVWRRLQRNGQARRDFRTLYNVGRGQLAMNVFPAYACAIGHLDRKSFGDCYCR
jgi:sphingomyelin phosphodiesterase acid-like 3